MLVAVPTNGQTWLICGGRSFSDSVMFNNAMSDILGMFGCPNTIVHGAARGADAMASQWAKYHACREIAVPADWKTNGKYAGPLRNREMLASHKPQKVIAFPGGRGTADMVRQARDAGVDVIEIQPTPAADVGG